MGLGIKLVYFEYMFKFINITNYEYVEPGRALSSPQAHRSTSVCVRIRLDGFAMLWVRASICVQFLSQVFVS